MSFFDGSASFSPFFDPSGDSRKRRLEWWSATQGIYEDANPDHDVGAYSDQCHDKPNRHSRPPFDSG